MKSKSFRIQSCIFRLVFVSAWILFFNHFGGDCGRLPADGKIVGGSFVPSMVPHQLSLRKNGHHHCGAVILSKKEALTTAHCFDQQELNKTKSGVWSIVAGSPDLFSSDGNAQTVGVESIKVHPEYDEISKESDVALLTFSQKLAFNEHVDKISLPASGVQNMTGLEVVVTGWGQTSFEDLKLPTMLQTVELSVISTAECRRAYEGLKMRVTENMLCAQGRGGGQQGACKGDSGGAMTSRIQAPGSAEKSKLVLLGLTSWGFECGHEKYPGVFTKVSQYLNWIHQERGWGDERKGQDSGQQEAFRLGVKT